MKTRTRTWKRTPLCLLLPLGAALALAAMATLTSSVNNTDSLRKTSWEGGRRSTSAASTKKSEQTEQRRNTLRDTQLVGTRAAGPAAVRLLRPREPPQGTTQTAAATPRSAHAVTHAATAVTQAADQTNQAVPLQAIPRIMLFTYAHNLVGLYKLNAVDPQLECTPFQPLNVSSRYQVRSFKVCFRIQLVLLQRVGNSESVTLRTAGCPRERATNDRRVSQGVGGARCAGVFSGLQGGRYELPSPDP
jgi:hypothetical protein